MLARMCARLTHRGPDSSGSWHDAAAARPVYLGFRRLVVLDPEGGEQPMRDASGDLAVVFNGEIYNHRELRAELTGLGLQFRSDHSDTEVLLQGWRAWGAALVDRLSGMFAFALYDRAAQRLFCARDRFGKKPFFYARVGETFAFASEATALLEHTAVPGAVSAASVEQYFAWGFVPAPASLYEGIAKLPPGHTLQYDLRSGELKTREYWRFRIRRDAVPEGSEREWAAQIEALLDRAVARRLQSDVPLGFFLSGGIDSTSVVAMASRHGSDLRTFSIGFDDPSYDESLPAALAASDYHTRHTSHALSFDEVFRSADNILQAMDEPIADPSLVPTALLSARAAEQVTVALAGDGGDELFAGYDTFRALKWARLLQALPFPSALSRAAALMPVSPRNMSVDLKLRRAARAAGAPAGLWHPLWLAPASPADLASLFGKPFDAGSVYAPAADAWERSESPDPADRAMEFYARFYLSGVLLTKVDRASMQASLEVRSPFLDNDLVDFAVRLPRETKFRRGRTKWILKRAMKRMVRPQILHRPKKGFGIPVVDWLRRLPMPDIERAEQVGLDGAYLRRCWREHREAAADHRGILWAWLALDRCLAGRLTRGSLANPPMAAA